MRVLVVEDDATLRKMVVRRLDECGYAVDSSETAEEAREMLRSVRFDCAVIDIRLPGRNGFELLFDIRRSGLDVPILFLTALDATEDRVRGLNEGADDYLVKPFAFDELIARVRALVRRGSGTPSNRVAFDDLEMDVARRTVERAGRPIDLTVKEFAVLEYLLRNREQVLTRSQIIDHVWSYSFDYDSNIIDVYIRYLRRKIDDPFERKLIHTVRGVGYVVR